VIDIAPAIDEGGWLGRSVLVDLGPIDPAQAQFSTTAVSIGGGTVGLPTASLALAEPRESVAVTVTLPTLIHHGAPEPVVVLRLRAAG
jgi:hypothetical protein